MVSNIEFSRDKRYKPIEDKILNESVPLSGLSSPECTKPGLPGKAQPSKAFHSLRISPMLSDSFSELARRLILNWNNHAFGTVSMLAAVSGGADSVALLRLLHHIWPANSPGRLLIAHFNHGLRGAASDGDECFVAELADQLGLELVVGRSVAGPAGIPGTESAGLPSEESLRNIRYNFLDSTAHRLGARYVVTAHTADDNIETFLHHLFRGTGPAGLAGIPAFRPLGVDVVLARPLLAMRRADLRVAMQELQQAWRTDASNQDSHWQRNWLRNELWPTILERYPDADQAISRLIPLQGEWVEHQRELSRDFVDRACDAIQGGWEIQCRNLPSARGIVQGALVHLWNQSRWPRRDMSAREWTLLLEMIYQGSPDYLNLPGHLRASISGKQSVVVERLSGD